LVLIVVLFCPFTYGKVIYVDDDVAGANDGTSWENAYIYLQDALAAAIGGDEIRVAQGIYKPDLGGGNTPGDREATFQLINDVILKGGFAGANQPSIGRPNPPNRRDVEVYETILSGDLNDDDVDVANPEDLKDEPTRAENSYHVLTGDLTDETAVLDGITITSGNANGPQLGDEYPDKYRLQSGGGMYNDILSSPTLTNCTFSGNSAEWSGGGMINLENGSPTLTNCTFSGNSADMGGGMYNGGSSPTLTNCTFSGNWAEVVGGGMYNGGSNPALTNCTFSGNSADMGGGGMYNGGSNPTLTNCTFSENSTEWGRGGGMYNWDSSSPTLSNCTFSGNSAKDGGGMHNFESNPTLVNCTFSRNSAEYDGGGMYNNSLSAVLNLNNSRYPILTNCTFSGNSAGKEGGGMYNDNNSTLANCIFSGNSARKEGGGMYNWVSGNPTLANCTLSGNSAQDGGGMLNWGNPALANCILRYNTPDQTSGPISWATITYSNIQGSFPGEGNIDADPLFAVLGYWHDNDTPDDPLDDYWVAGDYHLKSQAGRLDPNTQTWVKDDVTSPCIDAGDPLTPVMYEPHPRGCIINMGAYGGTEEASKSPF
jgi:hypothetical protein